MVFRARQISKSFGPTLALDQVDLSLSLGEVHALVGENGSGKSTLMRILHGEIAPDQGEMLLEEEPFRPKSPREAMDRGVALVHQELAVCGHMSIWENVFLGAERGVSFATMRRRTSELLGELGHPDLDPEAQVRMLSPAIRQLVEIARAMRSEARVILFDEPTSSLGRHDVDQLFKVIRQLRADRAIVYISHFLDEVEEIADRVTVLRDGRLVGCEPMRAGMTSDIVQMMTGRTAEQVYHRTERPAQGAALSAEHVAGKKLPRGISFDLRRGEVLGIAGLNGSGRTETVRCLFGLDAGQGSIATGEDSLNLAKSNRYRTPGQRWRQGVGYVSEDRKEEGLALNLTLAENLTMTNPRRRQTERTQAVIDRLGVKCRSPHQRIGALSGGNQQKVAIGRLLDQASEILILDEPTRGIDIGSKAEIFRLVDELANQGKSVILISSYLPELLGLCDRIAVMRRGEIVSMLDARGTTEHEVMQLCAGA